MPKASRMLVYVLLGLLLAVLGLFLFWYLQTRNVELARYQVIAAQGPMEIRAYPALTVAEVTRTGTRDQAVRSGFGPLARYIFAREREGEKIAMTAPVTQKSEDGSWTIQFIMPSGYTLDSLPKPAGTDVRLREIPATRRAAIRFSGWWSDELFRAKDAALREWLEGKGLETA